MEKFQILNITVWLCFLVLFCGCPRLCGGTNSFQSFVKELDMLESSILYSCHPWKVKNIVFAALWTCRAAVHPAAFWCTNERYRALAHNILWTTIFSADSCVHLIQTYKGPSSVAFCSSHCPICCLREAHQQDRKALFPPPQPHRLSLEVSSSMAINPTSFVVKSNAKKYYENKKSPAGSVQGHI